ncbi:MAG: PilT protein domain protein [Parcubacteria group bacterium GW2011_GWC2_45_7]|nr:MAG: PilT protein domain protein [Parcubacteria group bacterium GW2011_GWC2_45_7]KKU73727.1 MAG: PilT protein domain protein [Parcubacteria group bacterium GW2011_GWA2_47_26]
MTISILDANVLLRFLVRDNTAQYNQAQQWFKEAEDGRRKIIIIPLVVAEACYVLGSFYGQSRDSIADMLEIFISQRWLQVEERDVLLGVWQYYRKGLHFVDSYLRAWTDINGGTILSFDKALLKI